MVLRRIKDRVREKVGVTINEVGAQDQWQRAELGVAVASGDRRQALEILDQVVRVVMSASGGQLVGIAKDATTFDGPETTDLPADIVVDDRTGSGDKAVGQGDSDWVPEAWRDDLDG